MQRFEIQERKMKYQLLKEVLLELEEYETSHDDVSIDGFRKYLNRKKELEKVNREATELRDETLQRMSNQSFGIENQITYLIAMMWKYAKHYTKDGFKDLPIGGLDDFGFLAALSRGSMNKTALINMNIVEIPSGMDIIKRLTKQGFMTSSKDPNDKRAKILNITPAGRGVVGMTIVKLQQIAKIVIGDLTDSEQVQLLQSLEKLNFFHSKIHQNHWKSELDEVIEVYLN